METVELKMTDGTEAPQGHPEQAQEPPFSEEDVVAYITIVALKDGSIKTVSENLEEAPVAFAGVMSQYASQLCRACLEQMKAMHAMQQQIQAQAPKLVQQVSEAEFNNAFKKPQ